MAGVRVSTRWTVACLGIVAGIGAALLPWSEALGAAPRITALRFNITPVASDTLQSDGRMDSAHYQHSDFRFPDVEGETCVDAQDGSKAFACV